MARKVVAKVVLSTQQKANPNRTLTPPRHKRKRNPTNRPNGLRKTTKPNKRYTPPHKEHRKVRGDAKLKNPNLQCPNCGTPIFRVPVKTAEKEKSEPTNAKNAPPKYPTQNMETLKEEDFN